MAQLTRRANRTGLQVTLRADVADVTPTILLTDSKKFAWTNLVPTDSGNDISRFYRVFAIQSVAGSNANDGVNFTIQINVGGSWQTCPVGLIDNTNTGLAVIRTLEDDIAIVKLPVHGIQLRLLGAGNVLTTSDQILTILMSDSSERHDIGRV